MRLGKFPSISNYLHFLCAKKFSYAEENTPFPPNFFERIASAALAPLQNSLGKLIENINKPIIAAPIGIIGVGLITVFFYPDISFGILQKTCAPIVELESWMLKFAFFILCQSMLISAGVRTIARLNDSALLQAWHEKKIVPVHIGSSLSLSLY